ncbi:hypothetical protein GALMADRAFT_219127 [Galerina marginata CBS 339.88]|uniref:Uncharacterized protein n=1 Tax=Galerina marginata (strain CBS 339.88) TaxID=685588 RepID=A0A067TUV4_GALM3|nr:hypothetical protein GALMADRAFT_219127 [Galerina marginata CBS 339.88]
MSLTNSGPEAQDALFDDHMEHVPAALQRATMRMQFPPSYALVGVYRLFTDKLLYKPAWDKCRHATQRGAIVGGIWALLTFSIQRRFIELFLSNSPRITGLSRDDTVFGYKVPFSLYTYATIMILGSQVTYILRFFLSRNIRIARDRAWDQTVASRGKGPDFWQPYVEELQNPPQIDAETKLERWLGGWFTLFFVKRVLLSPFQVYPFVGMVVSAWFKAIGTSRSLHRRYFEAKKMTPQQVGVFIEERKWDYRIFGFTAALLENLPIIGLLFTVSNRVGAAMWAHDLEKRQHYVAEERKLGHEPASYSKTD